MFLFTDRAKPEARAKPAETGPFAQPLKRAAKDTGVSFEYLTKTAEKESGFKPNAKAGTSSATGMFQFIEQTWLSTLKAEGPKFGLAGEAAQIDVDQGKFRVADPATRQRIMALREDPAVSAMMAGAFAARNGQKLQETLGRKPNDGELYLAHFLGPKGASEFLGLRQRDPQTSAAAAFPDAASANRSVFFDAAGKSRSVEQVFERMTAGFSQSAVAMPDLQQKAIAASDGLFRVKAEGHQMHGLFRSKGEPVAEQVTQMFTGLSRFARKDIAAQRAIAQQVPFVSRAESSPATPATAAPTVAAPASAQAKTPSSIPKARPAEAPIDLMRFVKY